MKNKPYLKKGNTFIIASMAVLSALTCANAYLLLSMQHQVDELQNAIDGFVIPKIHNKTELNQFFKNYIHASGYDAVLAKADKPSPVVGSASAPTAKQPSTLASPSTDNDRVYGNVNAPFLLVLYSDFECDFCQADFPNMINLVDNSGGNIALVFKHTLGHGNRSLYSSTLVECAYQQKGNFGFFDMAKFMFDSKRNGSFNTPIGDLAVNFGLDKSKFTTCVNNGGGREKISFDTQEAINLKIEKTPSTIVSYQNKAVLIQGSVPTTELQAVMGQLTKKEQ